MTSCVYWIRCADHTDLMTQGYVGVSGRFNRRMWEHFHSNQNPHLQRAIQKYGWDNLVKSQILIADEGYCLDIERKMRPSEKIGWNLVCGGGKPPITRHNQGKKLSVETKKKISEKIKLSMQDPLRLQINKLARLGKPSPRKGCTLTEETRNKISAANKGQVSHRKGIILTDAAKSLIRKSVNTYAWTCPNCNKSGVGKGAATRWHFDNCKQKEFLNVSHS